MGDAHVLTGIIHPCLLEPGTDEYIRRRLEFTVVVFVHTPAFSVAQVMILLLFERRRQPVVCAQFMLALTVDEEDPARIEFLIVDQ
jgi:hypothetical protein